MTCTSVNSKRYIIYTKLRTCTTSTLNVFTLSFSSPFAVQQLKAKIRGNAKARTIKHSLFILRVDSVNLPSHKLYCFSTNIKFVGIHAFQFEQHNISSYLVWIFSLAYLIITYQYINLNSLFDLNVIEAIVEFNINAIIGAQMRFRRFLSLMMPSHIEFTSLEFTQNEMEM